MTIIWVDVYITLGPVAFFFVFFVLFLGEYPLRRILAYSFCFLIYWHSISFGSEMVMRLRVVISLQKPTSRTRVTSYPEALSHHNRNVFNLTI